MVFFQVWKTRKKWKWQYKKKQSCGNGERYKVREVLRDGESGGKKVMLCYMTSLGSSESLSFKLTILSHRLAQISNAGYGSQHLNSTFSEQLGDQFLVPLLLAPRCIVTRLIGNLLTILWH